MSTSQPYRTEALTDSDPEPVPLKLVVASGDDFGRELRLERGTYRVGNEEGNELVLSDRAVSRTHLLIEVMPNGVRLTDNESRNGSFCLGVKFQNIDAAPGTVVRIGRTDLKIVPADAVATALPPSARETFGELRGKSLVMRELFAVLERAATSNAPVLIEGATGTGKERCARAIHEHSARKGRPFAVCDLSAIVAELAESELFGHVRGAFTGAVADRTGAFQRALGGTLLLDEVGELPLEVQPRLLRALETGHVKRVGENDLRPVDVRVIAATNRDLSQLVAAGRFREDLYHRLAVVKVRMPELKERREDIPLLVDDMLRALGKPVDQLSGEARLSLFAHQWPGNVRELKNTVERAVCLGGPGPGQSELRTSFKEIKQQMVDVFEREYLANLVRSCGGNVSQASRDSGIDRVHLHRLLKKHGLAASGSAGVENGSAEP